MPPARVTAAVATPATPTPVTPPAPAPSAGATVASTTLGVAPTITQPAGARFAGPEPPSLRQPSPAMSTRLDRTP